MRHKAVLAAMVAAVRGAFIILKTPLAPTYSAQQQMVQPIAAQGVVMEGKPQLGLAAQAS
jgi:uncharacterized membrane protein affecting hemolysin expression